MNTVIAAFLLGFPALFFIVNPVSGAFIFRTRTIERSHVDRVRLARRVGVYAALVMLVALWTGFYVLAFFGISLPALRFAGASYSPCMPGPPSTRRNGAKRAKANKPTRPLAKMTRPLTR